MAGKLKVTVKPEKEDKSIRRVTWFHGRTPFVAAYLRADDTFNPVGRGNPPLLLDADDGTIARPLQMPGEDPCWVVTREGVLLDTIK